MGPTKLGSYFDDDAIPNASLFLDEDGKKIAWILRCPSVARGR